MVKFEFIIRMYVVKKLMNECRVFLKMAAKITFLLVVILSLTGLSQFSCYEKHRAGTFLTGYHGISYNVSSIT